MAERSLPPPNKMAARPREHRTRLTLRIEAKACRLEHAKQAPTATECTHANSGKDRRAGSMPAAVGALEVATLSHGHGHSGECEERARRRREAVRTCVLTGVAPISRLEIG